MNQKLHKLNKNEIKIDISKCNKCGKCIRMMNGYCIKENDGRPCINTMVCNICQKCISICPSQAITLNGIYPEAINKNNGNNRFENIIELFRHRRSIKHFRNEPVPRPIIEEIISVAKYAPNQNKNISILVIDNEDIIKEIDQYALNFVRTMYKIFFGIKMITKIIEIFYKDIYSIKIKMEYDLNRKHVIKENTQSFIILIGNRKIAVTESSAHYVLATMLYRAESLGIGNCIMDSILLTLNMNKRLRKKLGIMEDALAVLALGYSSENIVNIPNGYELDVRWNNS